MNKALHDILQHRRLQSLFQPIMDLDTGQVHGYEGLIRGPSDSMLHAPLTLLRAAEQAGVLARTELLCVDVLVADFTRQRLEGSLFINLSPSLMSAHPDLLDDLLNLIHRHQLSPTRVVIELTEDSAPTDAMGLTERLADYRQAGLRLALDDLGEGYSSLRRWSELRPHYVKIDKHFISGIHQDPVKLQFVRSLQQIADNSGARLIAEGIETRAEFALMRELGIGFGQGYFIARPAFAPSLSLEVLDAFKSAGRNGSPSVFQAQAGKLLISAPVLSPEDSNELALDTFVAHPQLHALAVVKAGQPVGLINRYTLIDHFSRVYVRELHGRRSCVQFMDAAPLVVDKSTPVEELSKLVINKGKATFTDGFIITDNGDYLGLGSGYDLMQLIMQLQVATARYSNPLTLLPGNVPINNHIQQMLAAGIDFHAAYCDLDNFKPYNDIYGYDRGDEIILMLAGILKDGVEANSDFLGHIGGDDFFILFRSEDWEARCRAILQAFESRCQGLFEPRHLDDGGYHSEDRCGRTVFHPLPCLSIGVVTSDAARFQTHHEVAAAAAVAKKQAKKLAGNSLFVERRRTQLDLPIDQAQAA